MTVGAAKTEHTSLQSSHDETGARFTHVYLQATEMLQDSKRARVRVASMLEGDRSIGQFIATQIQKELGEAAPYPRCRVQTGTPSIKQNRNHLLPIGGIVL